MSFKKTITAVALASTVLSSAPSSAYFGESLVNGAYDMGAKTVNFVKQNPGKVVKAAAVAGLAYWAISSIPGAAATSVGAVEPVTDLDAAKPDVCEAKSDLDCARDYFDGKFKASELASDRVEGVRSALNSWRLSALLDNEISTKCSEPTAPWGCTLVNLGVKSLALKVAQSNFLDAHPTTDSKLTLGVRNNDPKLVREAIEGGAVIGDNLKNAIAGNKAAVVDAMLSMRNTRAERIKVPGDVDYCKTVEMCDVFAKYGYHDKIGPWMGYVVPSHSDLNNKLTTAWWAFPVNPEAAQELVTQAVQGGATNADEILYRAIDGGYSAFVEMFFKAGMTTLPTNASCRDIPSSCFAAKGMESVATSQSKCGMFSSCSLFNKYGVK